MEGPESKESLIRSAAARGARSVCTTRQVVADAIDCALERWEDACIRRKQVEDWQAWAFRVGANAAKRIAARSRTRTRNAGAQAGTGFEVPTSGNRSLSESERAGLRAELRRQKKVLKGRQLEILLKLAEPDMSLHRAAKELGMDRTSLRRSFRAAMARLARR